MKTVWLWTLVLALATVATAGATTIGCVQPDVLDSLLGPLFSLLGGGTFYNIPSPDSCVATCSSIGRPFAYWSSGSTVCYCTNDGANINQITSTAVPVDESWMNDLCAPDDYQLQVIGLPYVLQACATPSSVTGSFDAPSTPWTISDCLVACQDSGSYALVTLGSTSVCNCATGVMVAPAGTGRCMEGNTAVYRNTAVVETGPSGLKRRKRKSKENKSLCPGTMTACSIAGHGDSHECIDTQNELESCGGCTAGVFGNALDRRVGLDCSRIPGVALSGVSCVEGRCVVSSCKRGWTIDGGSCSRRI